MTDELTPEEKLILLYKCNCAPKLTVQYPESILWELTIQNAVEGK